MLDETTLTTLFLDLVRERECFHSEDDLKFALAWKLKENFPKANIRLERPYQNISGPGDAGFLDLLFNDGTPVGIELKYKTIVGRFTSKSGEIYNLKEQSAQDGGRHGFCFDVYRLENLVREKKISQGFAVFLTNDSLYWRLGRKETNDSAFRIHDDRILQGTLAWNPKAGKGTTEGIEKPIPLSGTYPLSWTPGNRQTVGNGFRFLVVSVGMAGRSEDGSKTD